MLQKYVCKQGGEGIWLVNMDMKIARISCVTDE